MKKKNYLWILGVILFIFTLFYIPSTIKKVCFNNNCFTVELAKTPEEHAKGLMYREFLALNSGMLFVFSKEEIQGFWMKNTFIPLDIIGISKDKKVVTINKNAIPCEESECTVIVPDSPALYVLEINAGLSDKLNIHEGDKVRFK